jgi:hypothetical protein
MVTGATTRRVVKLEEQGSESAHVAFNFEDIRQKCDEFIEQTRAKAAQMLVQAHEDAEKVKAAAMQQGLKMARSRDLLRRNRRSKPRLTRSQNRNSRPHWRRSSLLWSTLLIRCELSCTR